MSALPKKKQDWAGLTRDTGVFMATQFLAIGALYAMPVEVSGWTREDKEQPIYKRWKEHTQQIVWDKDAWYINYMLHPYWGGTYYIRAHERGFGEVGSFWFAMLLSSLFEYGGEALFEPASLQDVLVTPIMGIMVGRWFEEIRAPILLKHDRDNYEQWVLWLTDPIGIASRWLERKTHWNATFGFAHITTAYSLDNHVSQTPTLGLKVHF
ncbi:MAG: DUF3943 domain-containing protein [Gammaproteobacteria bacterium]|nr:DUF3943 domain-containing protein [Gammaproteobacteria bacterium]